MRRRLRHRGAAVAAISNGAITLYTINPNVKTIADFTDQDRSPDAVSALSAGHGKATITAHAAVQPFTERGLQLFWQTAHHLQGD